MNANTEDAPSHDDTPPGEIVECTSCGKRTTMLEADCRRFNRGRCGKCGGPLFPIEKQRKKEQQL